MTYEQKLLLALQKALAKKREYVFLRRLALQAQKNKRLALLALQQSKP